MNYIYLSIESSYMYLLYTYDNDVSTEDKNKRIYNMLFIFWKMNIVKICDLAIK